MAWSFVDFPSNASVLELLEGRAGILALVDDETWFPGGTDKKVATKLSVRRADLMRCGVAAAAARTFRGDEPRRRRGCRANVPWRRAETLTFGLDRRAPRYRAFGGDDAPPSPLRRGVLAAATRIRHPDFRVDASMKVAGGFVVKHYAGPVRYETDAFLRKNRAAPAPRFSSGTRAHGPSLGRRSSPSLGRRSSPSRSGGDRLVAQATRRPRASRTC